MVRVINVVRVIIIRVGTKLSWALMRVSQMLDLSHMMCVSQMLYHTGYVSYRVRVIYGMCLPDVVSVTHDASSRHVVSTLQGNVRVIQGTCHTGYVSYMVCVCQMLCVSHMMRLADMLYLPYRVPVIYDTCRIWCVSPRSLGVCHI